MKGNTIRRNGGSARAAAAVVAAAAVAAGAFVGYEKLRAVWLEQCRIEDLESQVSITPGTMVQPDIIAEEFGLRPGANLALIDFDERRKAILKKIPNLRAISVVRKLPDKVSIATEERKPVARMGINGRKTPTGKVVDDEGVVFLWQRGTRLLPVIREASAPGSQPGGRLGGRSRAALELIQTCRESDFQDISILEVDVSSPDYLLATLGSDYSRLKIAWEGMDGDRTAASHRSLVRQLTMLKKAMNSRIGDKAAVWNATDLSKPGRIYADTKEPIR